MNFSDQLIEDVKEAFELFSVSGDGNIIYNQVGDVLRALGLCPTNEQVLKMMGNPNAEELNTKTMSCEEFLPIYDHLSKSSNEVSIEDFVEGLKVFDKDGNGTVMGAEIRHVLTTLGEKLSPSEVNTVMKGREDASGSLNYEDFSKFLLERLI